jgi:hypothetical protein
MAKPKVGTEVRVALAAAVREWDAKLEAHTVELSEQLRMDEDECRKALVHIHKWKKHHKSRKYNERSALIWKWAQELNSDGAFFFPTRCWR